MPSIEKILKVQLVMILCFTMPNLMMDIFIPQLHTLTTLVLYATVAYTVAYMFENKQKYNNIFIFYVIYFLIYSIVIYFDLTIDRKYPLTEMLGCPKSVSNFITTTLIILLFIIQAPLYKKIKDFSFLIKSYIILNLPLVLFYINTVGVVEIQFDESITDISTLTLASTASNCLLLAIIFRNSFTKSKILNKALLVLVFLATMSVWGNLAKRGAILWFFVTLILYYLLKSKNIKYTLVKCGIVIGIVYLAMPIIISGIEQLSPFLAERIEATIVEGNTSGRMDEDGGFEIATKQFYESPITGSYFRIVTTNPLWQGMYPHNIILEILITFGVLGLIPLIYFLWKILINLRYSFKNSQGNQISIEQVLGIMFINMFFSMMTSGTLLLSLPFWVNIAILLTTINKKNDKLFNYNTTQKQS